MHSKSQGLPGGDAAEEDLRLPRPPGVVRRFWTRHPRLADILLVLLTLLLGLPTFLLLNAETPSGPLPATIGWILAIITSVALLWRRRQPLTVFVVAFSPIIVYDPVFSSAITGIAPAIALYSVAVYRSNRAAMWALVTAVSVTIATAVVWMLASTFALSDAVSLTVGTAFLLLVAALIGVNVGSRKRYVEALIDRSRQLARERDQQAQLASAAERTRIAREMHDIVSHSLAVVVTLAEGAHASADLEQTRRANRAIADTARDALGQMRVMLGVLRSEQSPEEADAPREPTIDLKPGDVIATARSAGVPASLTITGSPEGSDLQQLAVLRLVQEGLTNAMRYSRDASFVRVETDYSGDRIRVRIENDGVGSQPRSRGSGVGLQGLAERVTALGGTFSAGPGPGKTWLLSAELPKERPSE